MSIESAVSFVDFDCAIADPYVEYDDRKRKWDLRYLDLAANVGDWSKHTTKIGSVAVGDIGQILSQGYNGLPRSILDKDERYQNRELHYKFVVHAEMNCIYNACHNGVSLKGSTIYVINLPVCSECAKGMIQVGIKRVVSRYNPTSDHATRWIDASKFTKELLCEAGIMHTEYDDNNKVTYEW